MSHRLRAVLTLLPVLCTAAVIPATAAPSILTQHTDNARDGANTSETILTPANVNETSFGKLFTVQLDASVNGQVLYVPGLTIGGAAHNVIYAYTTNNSNGSPSSIWAFDADGGSQLWHTTLTTAAEWTTCAPVIDASTNIIYVLTKSTNDSGATQLHAFDITTGIEKPGSPITVSASVLGTGDGNSDGVVSFDSAQENDRPALLEVSGVVYVSFAHNTDSPPYHGWIIGYSYSGSQFTQTAAFCTTPNGSDGGIWMAGDGLAADANGDIYAIVGNGTFDIPSGGIDYGMSFLKLTTPNLNVADYFAPHDEQGWSNGDADTGAAGVALIPNTTALFGGQTKFGSIFVLNENAMGGYNTTTDDVINRIDNLASAGTSTQNPVAWDSGTYKYVYDWAPHTDLLEFRYDPGVGALNPAGVYLQSSDNEGGGLCVSSSGTSNGILWADGLDNEVHALNALDVSQGDLWNSAMNSSRDGVPGFPHWTFPMVANGKVYVPTGSQIAVYGLLAAPQPPGAPTGLAATPGNGQVGLTWTGSSGAASYNVYRGTSAGAESSTPVATGVTSTAYTDSAVVDGTAYYYTVAAVNNYGTSGMSNEVSAAPFSATNGSGGISINCGGAAASPFVADTDFTGGATSNSGNTIGTSLLTGTIPPQAVLQSNRYGTFTYTVPGLTNNGTYTVTLYFAEEYWTAAGKRVFDVSINGNQVLTNFDIFAAAGSEYNAVEKSFSATASSSGQIVISTTSVSDNPQINGIVIAGGSASPPTTPTGVSATAGNAQVSLSWTASTGATSYNIYRSDTSGNEGTTPYATSASASYTDTGVTNGDTYYYTVAAVNGSGTSAQSTEVNATPAAPIPATPTGLAASPNNGSVSLIWNASGGATSYNIYRGTTSGGEGTTTYASGVTSASFIDFSATNGVTYYYTVAAVSTGGTSAQSTEASATPSASIPQPPSNLAGTGGVTQISLTWTASTGATSYNIYRSTKSFPGPGPAAGAPVATSTTASYTNTGLTAGTTYYYVVTAVDASGMSVPSNKANATPTSGAATNVISINCGGAATGTWVADTDFTGGNTSAVENTITTTQLTGTIPPQAVLQSNRYGTFTYTIPGLTAGSSYSVNLYFAEEYWTAAGKRIFDVSINGTQVLTNFDIYATAGGADAAIQATFSATANSSGDIVISTTNVTDNAQINGIAISTGGSGGAPSLPPAPTGLTATASNAQVSLAWTGSSGATSYNVYSGTTSGGESSTPIATGITGTTDTVTGLTNGTPYFFTVAAVNAAGTSGMSNEQSATPSAGTSGSGGIAIDCGGAASGTWVADTDFAGGGTQDVGNTIGTSLLTSPVPPQAVLESNRYGAFTYTIPGLTAGGSYTVTLYFAEEYWTAAGQRIFDVSINGTQVLSNFDIFAAAGSEYNAVQESFTATANSSGQIVIQTASVKDNAQINGILIGGGSGGGTGGTAPSIPTGLAATAGNAEVGLTWTAVGGATSYNIYRGTASGGESATPIATGLTGASYMDTSVTNGTTYYYTVAAVNSYGTSGQSTEASATPAASSGPTVAIASGSSVAYSPYVADIDFTGGVPNSWTNAVSTSLLSTPIPPAGVLQQDRESPTFTYTIPGLVPNSAHSVTLYFVEQYWTAAGKRVFSVTSNGATVVSNLDIYATAGGDYKAIQETFNTTASSSGQIVLVFTSSADQSKCSGIAVY